MTELSVRNLALLEDARLEFAPGFLVLTGETGAGKSILLDALGLALGRRADPGQIRQGADRLSVAVRFRLSGQRLSALLKELGLEGDDDALVLRREVDAGGKSRAFVNDHPVSAATLAGGVGVMAGGSNGLLELASLIAPVVAGGNTCVVVASEQHPLPAVTFAEVLATSDLPGGVVNLLTGFRSELLKPLVSHMDINAIVVADATKEERILLDTEAATNMKRVVVPKVKDWTKEEGQSPYMILDTQEVKTTWHPIEKGQGGGGAY